MGELIEELTKVRPDELSKEGLKLFEKINEIIDKNKELESALDNSVSKDEIKEKIEAIDEELEIMRVDNMYGRYKDYGGKMKFEEMFTYKYAKKDTYNELLNKGE